ncbi:MAG: ribbon-helix-helix protein, CopG family [Zoogloeaceae bacterium]|nr:ribbon-helix-helix protein, CopG family [Zoogloeaceae bacterium]MCZ2148201.1 ribbon-helix-helix protein, CopG family [Bryobacterales bacterium]
MEKLTLRLSATALAGLRQLARKNGRSVPEEIRRAVDAHLLGTSPGEYVMLEALSDKFVKVAKEFERTLDQALHKTERRKKAPAYPADDGPLTDDQIAQIRSQAKPSMNRVRSSLSRNLPRRAAQSKRSGSG